ncbi:hypothetical protein TI05_12085 [Achromatium sp. WMS3]|nr:hypothetical protein TI05_12085 [Achromatium sp. WMS3]
MKPRFLLDTNILSEPLKAIPNPCVLKQLDHYQAEIATGSIVIYEIIKGAYRLPPSKKRNIILAYLDSHVIPKIPIYPYDKYCAEWQGQEEARLLKIGITSSPIDMQIAAIAVTQNLILVTRNTSDFQNIENLTIENWFNC